MSAKMQYEVLADTGEVRWRAEDGTEAVFTVRDLPENILRGLLAWGLHYILRNRTGAAKNPADRIAAAREIYERLRAGEWAKPRATGERKPRVSKYILAALIEVKGWDEETARDFIAGLTPEQRKALPHHPKIAPVIARLRAEEKGYDMVLDI